MLPILLLSDYNGFEYVWRVLHSLKARGCYKLNWSLWFFLPTYKWNSNPVLPCFFIFFDCIQYSSESLQLKKMTPIKFNPLPVLDLLNLPNSSCLFCSSQVVIKYLHLFGKYSVIFSKFELFKTITRTHTRPIQISWCWWGFYCHNLPPNQPNEQLTYLSRLFGNIKLNKYKNSERIRQGSQTDEQIWHTGNDVIKPSLSKHKIIMPRYRMNLLVLRCLSLYYLLSFKCQLTICIQFEVWEVGEVVVYEWKSNKERLIELPIGVKIWIKKSNFLLLNWDDLPLEIVAVNHWTPQLLFSETTKKSKQSFFLLQNYFGIPHNPIWSMTNSIDNHLNSLTWNCLSVLAIVTCGFQWYFKNFEFSAMPQDF